MKKRNRKQGIKDIKLISNVIHILSATEVLLFEFKISFEVNLLFKLCSGDGVRRK